MALNDQYVGVGVDGAGKKVDTTELTVNGVAVERQRFNNADPVLPGAIQTVDLQGKASVADTTAVDVQRQILIELRVISSILAQGFNVEVDSIRNSLIGE